METYEEKKARLGFGAPAPKESLPEGAVKAFGRVWSAFATAYPVLSRGDATDEQWQFVMDGQLEALLSGFAEGSPEYAMVQKMYLGALMALQLYSREAAWKAAGKAPRKK